MTILIRNLYKKRSKFPQKLKQTKSQQNLVFLSILLLFVSSCVGFNNNNLPKVQKNEISFNNKKKAKVFIDFVSHSRVFSNTKLARSAKNNFIKFITDSGCCTVSYNKRKSDIVIIGDIYDDNNHNINNITAAITGATLYLIPSWSHPTEHILFRVDSRSKGMKEYDLKDSITMVQWLPLIVATPFKNPITLSSKLQTKIFENLLLNMKNDGYIR